MCGNNVHLLEVIINEKVNWLTSDENGDDLHFFHQNQTLPLMTSSTRFLDPYEPRYFTKKPLPRM